MDSVTGQDLIYLLTCLGQAVRPRWRGSRLQPQWTLDQLLPRCRTVLLDV